MNSRCGTLRHRIFIINILIYSQKINKYFSLRSFIPDISSKIPTKKKKKMKKKGTPVQTKKKHSFSFVYKLTHVFLFPHVAAVVEIQFRRSSLSLGGTLKANCFAAG